MAQTTDNALIFIPDISGFTEFVKENEIRHSQHILSELLSIIIESNNLSLKVSEIEGDAVLFYRFGKKPDLDTLYEQSKTMFINFHAQLKKYKTNFICECGACSKAHKLSLKIIAHYGELSEIKIKNHTKLHGPDLILAHRLLKNEVPGHQYLLMTQQLFHPNSALTNAIPFELVPHVEEIENFGKRETGYIDFDNEIRTIPDPPIYEISTNFEENPVRIEKIIDCPMDYCYSTLIDNSTKLNWVPGIQTVKNGDKPPSLGDSHQCIFNNFSFDIRLIHQEKSENEKIFVEKSTKLPIIGEAVNVYRLKRKSKDQTALTFELHIPKTSLRLRLVAPFIKPWFKRNLFKSLNSFKEYVENQYR